MSVPSSANRVFWAAQTTYTLSGQTFSAIADIALKWGYKIHEEATTGVSLPYLGTGVFHGEANIDALGSNDNRFESAVSVSSGVAPTFGMTWRELDTTGTGASGARTWTLSGKFTEFEIKTQKDQVITYKLKAILGTEPTVVNS